MGLEKKRLNKWTRMNTGGRRGSSPSRTTTKRLLGEGGNYQPASKEDKGKDFHNQDKKTNGKKKR